MLEFGTCPRCRMDISPERKSSTPVICNHCGYTVTASERQLNERLEKRISAVMISLSALVVIAYVQLLHWDNHSLSIIPLTVKEYAGISSPSDWEHKAQICFDLKKWDCVESAYIKTARVDARLWQRAGDFQSKREKYAEAAQSYFQFFQNGGDSIEASYAYAKALSKLGHVDDAVRYFDQVIAARPEVLQVTVIKNYVDLLMRHQRYNQAKVLIQDIRKRAGPGADLFMDSEMEQIQSLTTASRE
ncbi:MAG: tetratricopeptide repeat protein [Bdellovibrionales bacterium]